MQYYNLIMMKLKNISIFNYLFDTIGKRTNMH